MEKIRGSRSVGYIRTLKFCGLLIATLRILSDPRNADFISLDYLRSKLHKITKVGMHDKVIESATAYLVERGYIEEFFVKTEKRKKIRILRIKKEGRIQLKKLRRRTKGNPGLVWIE